MRSLKITSNNAADYEAESGVGDNNDTWLYRIMSQIEKNDSKTAVEVARERTPGVTEQIYSIINHDPRKRYSTVEEAVADYQRRVGLVEYHKRAIAEEIVALAEEELDNETTEKKTPEIIERIPQLETFINNVLTTNPHIQLPAVINKITEVFTRNKIHQSELDSPDLIRYINNKIMEKQRPYYNNDYSIGRNVGTQIDYEMNDSNRDPFAGLVPKRLQ